MKSLVEPLRTTWPCLSKWFLCFIIMGAISPGRAEDLGFENSPHPRHWQNNSTPSVLYVRVGYYLQIMPDQKVGGVRDHRPFLNVTHITSEKNTTAIQSTDTKLFLCMDAKSKVYARPKFLKKDCEWIEQILPIWYSAYLHKHHMLKKDVAAGRPHDIPFYLGIDKDGSMRLGKESRKEYKSSQFIRSSVNASFSTDTSTSASTTTSTDISTTARRKPLKLGCKGLRIKYCKRMRRRRKQGKSIKHAKRHRKCKRRRFSYEGKTLQDIKKLKRLRKRCLRIQRKRSERKRKVSRTSVNTPKPSRVRRRRRHRTQRPGV